MRDCPWMTYIVTDNCIVCKYTDCVEVCPVDCFYEGENMLVIHPDECIDCGVCEPECPAEAIGPDTESGLNHCLEINTKYASICPISPNGAIPCPRPRSGTARRASLKSTSRKSPAKATDRAQPPRGTFRLPKRRGRPAGRAASCRAPAAARRAPASR